MNVDLDADLVIGPMVLRGSVIKSELERQREHPDLSTVIDYVLFTFHCFDAQSGQVFY